MIKDITELNFPPYATLSQATVNIEDMGDNTITTQVKINGDISPDFSYDWEIMYKGEKYIMSLRKPQGTKDTSSTNSIIDLTFRHWAIHEMKRFFFVEMTSLESGTAIADKYIASVSLNLYDFVTALNNVLDYYYNGKIKAEIHKDWIASTEAKVISISYTKIWDLVCKIYELFAVRWQLVTTTDGNCIIKIGYPTEEIDHFFEYGWKGALTKTERQVQSEDIYNNLLGRGGSKNIPYRYFKDVDPENPLFPADPDFIPELANVYFSELRDAAFRSYVQGWKARHYGGTVTKEQAAVDWAYLKGYNDDVFNPVEYVKDDESIAKYGELWGALDNNEDIYPTIQGVTISPFGRIDEVVDVETIISDKIEEDAASEVQLGTVSGTQKITHTELEPGKTITITTKGGLFHVESGMTANLSPASPDYTATNKARKFGFMGDWVYTDMTDLCEVEVSYNAFKKDDENTPLPIKGLTEGSYFYRATFKISNKSADKNFDVTISIPYAKLESTELKDKKFTNTFDIWIKNIFNTTKGDNESNSEYAERVWQPILGDRTGEEAKVVFSDGLLGISEDYEFTIVSYPEYDLTKSFNGVQSHWKLTLAKSDAELEATGLYLPNTKINAEAGNHFFFIGIDMPYMYYTEAEKRLTADKTDKLNEVKDIKPQYVVSLDRVRISNPLPNELPIIDKLKVGAAIRLLDKRFITIKDEEGNIVPSSGETLFIQSISYTYREPSSNDAALNPDVEIVLSEKYASNTNTISTIQSEVSALSKQIGSLSNIEQYIRGLCDKIYLRKDGISDRSYSPTQFLSLLTSGDFRSGMLGGQGWGIYKNANGKYVFEIDKVNARIGLEANTLVINQIDSRSGMIVESAASMKVTAVDDTSAGYVCYFDQNNGTVANLFHLDDVAFSQQYTPLNAEQKYYKRRVIAVDEVSITLSKTDVNGIGVPEVGDVIVHFGNYTDKTRQYVKVRDVINGGYERYLGGLDSVNATGDEYYFVGRQYGLYGGLPRLFLGDKEKEFLEYLNGKLNIKGSLSVNSTIGDKTFEEYIQEVAPPVTQDEIEGFVENIMKPTIDNLQEQIDGVIETWFYEGVPTLDNHPANEWTSQVAKINHLGDLYYDNNTGTAYRFSQKEDKSFYWNVITDDAISKALAAAKEAQDTADNKRRVFISQPKDSDTYDEGDLWVNATYPSNGSTYKDDILRANQHKDAGSSFNISHWSKSSKYTDDTLAKAVQTQVNNLQSELNDLDSEVGAMQSFTNKAFADGIIDRSESAAIRAYLNTLATITNDVQKAYDSLTSSSLLPSATKTNIQNLKAVFDAKNNALVVLITNVIADDKATTDERAQVNAAYTEFNTAYANLIYALNQANTEIMGGLDININKLAYLQSALRQDTVVSGGLILSSIISLGVNNSDFTTQETYSGLSGIYDNSKRGKGIAAWYGGDMIDLFDYYNAETGEFVNIPDNVRPAKGVDRMDGTGYRANGNLWWDANGVLHADPLSFFVGEATVGALLASLQIVLQADGKHPDYIIPKVPFQRIDVSDLVSIASGGSLKIGNGYLKWDDTNKGFYLEDKDGNLAGIYGKWVSALGASSISGGGGGGIDYLRLDKWADYDSTKAGYVLSALLGNDLNTRLTTIESNEPTNKALLDYFNHSRVYYIEIPSMLGDLLYSPDRVKLGTVYSGNLNDLESNDVVINPATPEYAGVMSAYDKEMLDIFNAERDNYLKVALQYAANYITLGSKTDGDVIINAATVALAGLMSAADKILLDSFNYIISSKETHEFRLPYDHYISFGSPEDAAVFSDEDYLIISTNGITYGRHNSDGEATQYVNIAWTDLVSGGGGGGNTDHKVEQLSASPSSYPLLLGYSPSTDGLTNTTETNSVRKARGLTYGNGGLGIQDGMDKMLIQPSGILKNGGSDNEVFTTNAGTLEIREITDAELDEILV